jgi:hypothetical protein
MARFTTSIGAGLAAFGDPRSTVAAAFARCHNQDQDAGNTPSCRSLHCTIRPIPMLLVALSLALVSLGAAVGGGRALASERLQNGTRR